MSSIPDSVALPRPIALVFDRVLDRPWRLVTLTAMVFWSGALFVVARSEFHEFRYGRFDLGNMVQAVWSTAHGRPLEVTIGSSGEQLTRFAGHIDPILALFAPLWILMPSPLMLAAVQIGACALGALPVFWLGCRHLQSERLAALLALTYLAYPWLAWSALDAVHPVVLATPLMLFAVWFLDTDRPWPAVLVAVLACMTGELIGLTVAALGIWYALARGRRPAGLGIAAVGLAWTVLCVYIVLPAARGGPSIFYDLYAPVGGSPQGVIRTAFTDPGAIASALLTGRDLFYLLALVLPFAGLCFLAPALALVAAPTLAANHLSSLSAATDPRAHYVSAAIPFLIAASVLGVARIRESRRSPAVLAALGLSIGCTLAFGPWPGVSATQLDSRNIWYYGVPSTAHFEAVRAAVSLVPADASVSSTNKAGSHLSGRRYIYSIPLATSAEWVVLDMQDPWVPFAPKESARSSWGRFDPGLVAGFKRRLEHDRQWTRVFARDHVFVYRRSPA